MRRMALAHALLVGVTGCNWAFGLNPTQTWDAGDAPPDSPPGVKTTLVWGAVTSDGMGAVDPTITYAGIGIEPTRPEVPVVQVGPLDATLGPLADASYSTANGTFEVPYTLRDAPHRIVYTLPNDPIPHEVQWSETGAYLVVPRYMRMDAPLVPAGAGFSITPQGAAGVNFGIVYTSGTFTVNDVPTDFDTSTTTLTFRYADKARPLSKPLGGIESAKGDWVLVTDWKARTGFTSVSGFALAKNIDLGSTLTVPAPQPTWVTGDVAMSTTQCPGPRCIPMTNRATSEARMKTALGPLVVDSTLFERMRYGIVPSLELPPYLPGVAPDFIDRSTMLYFAEAYSIALVFDVADPATALAYPRVVDALMRFHRTVHGVALYSTMQEMVDPTKSDTIKWRAPLATSIMLGSTSLSGADDVPFDPTAGQVTLSFNPDNAVAASDYTITLSELANATLTPLRAYHVTAPSAKIDGSLLKSGHTYVFTIASRLGLPMAAQGDYRVVSFPFSTATTATATFVVQ